MLSLTDDDLALVNIELEKVKLIAQLERYQMQWPKEAELVAEFKRFIRGRDDCFGRNNQVGHVTGSAIIVDDSDRVLLLHHKKLDIWTQPGGHSDGSPDTLGVACREAEEETGLTDLEIISPDIFDISRYSIPLWGEEKDHYHYDLCFLLKAPCPDRVIGNEESHDIKWFELKDFSNLPALADSHLQKTIKKYSGEI